LTIVGIVGDESLERLGEPILLADGSPSSQVMASGKPLIFASGSGSGGAAAAAAPHGTLAVPITERNTTVGVLEVRGRAGRSFGEDELRFSESAANLIATTLQRARSEEALSHAQRLESVGQLTGGIAHDFNNLLTVIQGNLQILEELPELAHSAHANDMLQSALRAAQRGAALTGKLLTFSRRQMLQPVPVDVRVMLHSLCDMLYRTVDQRIRIEVDVPARELPVLADLAQLESALLNVALNSRDAMPRGGTILFRAEVCTDLPVAAREMLDQAVPAGMPFVEIAISDTGSGMADHVKARVFEPFFTTKEVGRGTGLGLSTVYGYLKQSKGAITVESEPGVGTRISLFLPLLEGSIVVTRESPRESRAFGRGLRALLVEDDDAVRDVVEAFLEGLDIKVTSLRTAEDAVAELSRSQIDLVISDVALGEGMRGTELARVIGRTAPSLPVILMSGYSAELIDEDRDVGNVRELLRKPFRREEFARAVAEALASHPDIDPPSSAIAG
jgi:signal transduction histidine kinase/ActR/RegA family two-component response regulator